MHRFRKKYIDGIPGKEVFITLYPLIFKKIPKPWLGYFLEYGKFL